MTNYNSNPFGNYASANVEKREVIANTVPAGTSKEVLAWVGDDLERAQRALDAEKATVKPRAGLVKPLKKLLA